MAINIVRCLDVLYLIKEKEGMRNCCFVWKLSSITVVLYIVLADDMDKQMIFRSYLLFKIVYSFMIKLEEAFMNNVGWALSWY